MDYTLCLGLVGLPIFAEGGGIWYVLKPSFGYIIGFALGSLVTGLMVEKQKNLTMGRLLAANFTGLAIVYACGMIYYYIICNFVIGTPIAFWPLFLYCFLLAVPGDICLCFVGAFLQSVAAGISEDRADSAAEILHAEEILHKTLHKAIE